jgi:hypothetical protein
MVVFTQGAEEKLGRVRWPAFEGMFWNLLIMELFCLVHNAFVSARNSPEGANAER